MDTNDFLEKLSQKFDKMDDKLDSLIIEITRLNERSKNDNRRLEELDKDVDHLKKWAYMAFLPFSLVVSIVLGYNFIPPMF